MTDPNWEQFKRNAKAFEEVWERDQISQVQEQANQENEERNTTK